MKPQLFRSNGCNCLFQWSPPRQHRLQSALPNRGGFARVGGSGEREHALRLINQSSPLLESRAVEAQRRKVEVSLVEKPQDRAFICFGIHVNGHGRDSEGHLLSRHGEPDRPILRREIIQNIHASHQFQSLNEGVALFGLHRKEIAERAIDAQADAYAILFGNHVNVRRPQMQGIRQQQLKKIVGPEAATVPTKLEIARRPLAGRRLWTA